MVTLHRYASLYLKEGRSMVPGKHLSGADGVGKFGLFSFLTSRVVETGMKYGWVCPLNYATYKIRTTYQYNLVCFHHFTIIFLTLYESYNKILVDDTQQI